MNIRFTLGDAYLLLLFTCVSSSVSGQCKIDYSNYHLVLNEDFDNISAVSDLLANTWQFTPYHSVTGGWGSEYFDQSQVQLLPMDANDLSKGKIIRLTAQKISPMYLPGRNQPIRYKSGMLLCQKPWNSPCWAGNEGFKYGIFEMRAKLPPGDPFKQDVWPTFWLTNGPTEIDILDQTMKLEQKKLYTNVIYWDGYPNKNPTDWTYLCDVTSCSSLENTPDFVSKLDYPAWSLVKQDGKIYYCDHSVKHVSAGLSQNLVLPDLDIDYHTFTAVWTPLEVAFFFDGRLQYKISATNVKTSDCPISIMANLQMKDSADGNSYNMDIDYIKVYQINDPNNFSLPYINSTEHINHDITASVTPTPMDISPKANAIITNPTNPNEIFYRGADNYLYNGKRTNGNWAVKRVEFDDGDPNLTASLIGGDVRYSLLYNSVFYISTGGRINFFRRTTSGFTHGHLHNNWNASSSDLVSLAPGSLQMLPNGDMFFIGADFKIHKYSFDMVGSAGWVHMILPYSGNTNELAKGDLEIEPGTLHPHYKGGDNRVQLFWKDGNGDYYHKWAIDNIPSYNVGNTAGGAMAFSSSEGLFYVGSDNKIHNLKWNNTIGATEHTYIPYVYGAPTLGYANADYVRGSLAWDEGQKKIYYAGYDGRIQAFVKTGGNWQHTWIDDYWSTNDYCTFFSTDPIGNSASIILGSDAPNRSIFYVRYPLSNNVEWPLPSKGSSLHLSYFKHEPCQPKIDPVGEWSNAFKMTNPDTSYIKSIIQGLKDTPSRSRGNKLNPISIKVSPNPTSGMIQFTWKGTTGHCVIEVTNVQGRLVKREEFNETIGLNDINVDISEFPSGLYNYELINSSGINTGKIIKE